MSSADISSRLKGYIIVMVLLLPVFFIGIRDTHDWGDDFAVYLQGAENLIHHRPVNEMKYIAFENYNHSYPPAAVPVGFPLLLAPVIKAFDLNFKALNYYMSFWLYAFGLVCFAFLRRYLSVLSSVCLTLIFFLNPFMIDFKSQVISDLPFAFFSTLALLLYLEREREDRLLHQLLQGTVIALLISVRSIGWCTFLCLGVDLMWRFVKESRGNTLSHAIHFLRPKLIWIVSFIVVYTVLGIIARHTGGRSFAFYISSYQGIHVWEMLMMNLNIYIQDFLQIFDHDAGIYGFGILITRSAMLFCFVLGFFLAVSRGYTIVLMYFFVYAFSVLLSPFNNQGFRLFFPLWPVIILFIAYGARRVAGASEYRPVWIIAVTVLIMLQYRSDLLFMHTHQTDPIYPTPTSMESSQGFDAIQNLTSDSDMIVCLKPRACAFFADRRFCIVSDAIGSAAQSQKLSISKPDFILVAKQIDDNRMESLAQYERDSAVYEDNVFKLYKRKM